MKMTHANYDNFVYLNDDPDPMHNNVTANDQILAFSSSSNKNQKPITSIKLALSKPCFEINFPSGLETNDNSIYQTCDYEYLFANVDTPSNNSMKLPYKKLKELQPLVLEDNDVQGELLTMDNM